MEIGEALPSRERLQYMYAEASDKMPKTCQCRFCRKTVIVDLKECLISGWPVCCGETMYLGDAPEPEFEIVENGTAITCKKCGMTSYSRNDVEHRYCGNCHEFLK